MPNEPCTKPYIDTNVMVEYSTDIFKNLSGISLSGFTLGELDYLKKNGKTEEVKFQARRATRDIEVNRDKITYIIDETDYKLPSCYDKENMDNKIIALLKHIRENDNSFYGLSNDLLFRAKCQSLGIPCEGYYGDENTNKEFTYKGYKDIILTEYELATFYECKVNKWDLLLNEYLLIRDGNGDLVDKFKWTEKGFASIPSKGFESIYLDKFKPKDSYQMFAIDSLNTMDFTLLSGMAGTGKTQLSLSYIMQNIEKINKAVIVFNPAKLKNSEQLGYYSGSRIEKLLQNSIGGILSSKLGNITAVETLINHNKLMILPTSDIRGIEVSDKDILYVTEAQNTDAYTMRTILQRAKQGCKIIIEGDMLEQRDLRSNNPRDNGMMRAIEVFKGSKYFSCVELKNTYRSPISEIAQRI